MIRTLNAGNSSFKCLPAINKVLFIKLNTNNNNINSQISVISMELLRKFNVKLVNMHKKYTITQYSFKKVLLYKFPGNYSKIIKNSYGLFMGRLARG